MSSRRNGHEPRASTSAPASAPHRSRQQLLGCLDDFPPGLRQQIISCRFGDRGTLAQHRETGEAIAADELAGGIVDKIGVYKALVFHVSAQSDIAASGFALI